MFEIVDQMIKVLQGVSCVLLGVFEVFDGVSQVIASVLIVENGVFDFCGGLGFAGEEGFEFFHGDVGFYFWLGEDAYRSIRRKKRQAASEIR
jgi:hypothetical protein